MKGQDIAVGMLLAGLAPDRGAARQALRARVAQASHAVQRPEIVIERAVLLHEDHDVLDVHDRAGAVTRGNGHGLGDRRGQKSGGRARDGGA